MTKAPYNLLDKLKMLDYSPFASKAKAIRNSRNLELNGYVINLQKLDELPNYQSKKEESAFWRPI